jgi:hypothetical protein
MSESELLLRLRKQSDEMKLKNQEAIERLERDFEEYLKKPFEEQMKMAREVLEHGYR